MPRASDYLIEGYTYHLTHRCHNREFHLRFVRDRNAYRSWLVEGIRRHRVPVYGYCLTSNHVHLIIHAQDIEAVSALMHLAAGSLAKEYNLRKGHLGSLWEHPYQCTVIEDGQHLLNALCYVDLNMVRAGLVSHPREWRWCGYDELSGRRSRYRLINQERLQESLGLKNLTELHELYTQALERRLAQGPLIREPYWTEALAVGTKNFVESICGHYMKQRRTLDVGELNTAKEKTWTLRESKGSYSSFWGDKNRF
jgi:putative transposase